MSWDCSSSWRESCWMLLGQGRQIRLPRRRQLARDGFRQQIVIERGRQPLLQLVPEPGGLLLADAAHHLVHQICLG